MKSKAASVGGLFQLARCTAWWTSGLPLLAGDSVPTLKNRGEERPSLSPVRTNWGQEVRP
jgi:hypothetical protein